MGEDEGQDDPGHLPEADVAKDRPEGGHRSDEEIEEAEIEPLEQAKAPRPAETEAQPSAAQRPAGQEARNWAVGAHLAGLSWLVSLPGLIGPLIIWLVKGKDHPLVEAHAKEAVNFQLSLLIYGIASVVLMLLLIGFVLIFIVALMGLILPIVAAVKTSDGEAYRYPLTLRLIT